MDRRLRLGIDLDGVVADFNAGWMRCYNAHFGDTLDTPLEPGMVVGWDQMVRLTHFPDMDVFWSWARTADDGEGIFRHLPTYPGAVEALRELGDQHHLVIVSHKFDWAIPQTLAWLSELALPLKEVHFVHEKATVACDVYLEDAPYQLANLRKARPEATVCRFVRPWNEPVDGCVDVTGWKVFTEVIHAGTPQSLDGAHRVW